MSISVWFPPMRHSRSRVRTHERKVLLSNSFFFFWNFISLVKTLLTPGSFSQISISIPNEVEPGRHPGDRVPDHVDQVHLQVIPLPIRAPHVSDVHRILFHILHCLHQFNLLFGISQIVLDIIMMYIDNTELVCLSELFEEPEHGRGAAFRHPGVSGYQ